MAFNFLCSHLLPELVSHVQTSLCAADTASVALTCRREQQVFSGKRALREATRHNYRHWITWWFEEIYEPYVNAATKGPSVWAIISEEALVAGHPLLIDLASAFLGRHTDLEYLLVVAHERFLECKPETIRSLRHLHPFVTFFSGVFDEWLHGSQAPSHDFRRVAHALPGVSRFEQWTWWRAAYEQSQHAMLDFLWPHLDLSRGWVVGARECLVILAQRLGEPWNERRQRYEETEAQVSD